MPAVTTDRHLIRVALRLHLVSDSSPESVEAELKALLPRSKWTRFSLRMTLHGRYVCLSRRPLWERCVVNDFCPSSTTAGWPMSRRRQLVRRLATLGHNPQMSQTSLPPAEQGRDRKAAHAEDGHMDGGQR